MKVAAARRPGDTMQEVLWETLEGLAEIALEVHAFRVAGIPAT